MPATLAPPPAPQPTYRTVGDLLRRLGGISADRVRWTPTPGTATAADARLVNDRDHVCCELIDGTLVEKPMGAWESSVAAVVIRLMGNFVAPRRLGMVTAPDGTFTVAGEQVRMPDVTFTTWARLAAADGGRQVWAPHLGPDLAVEVLSPSNTAAEIARKRRELFAGGTRLMWVADRPTRTFAVYTTGDGPPAAVRGVGETVDGGDVPAGVDLGRRRGVYRGRAAARRVTFARVTFARVTFARVTFARVTFARVTFARVTFARVTFARVTFARVTFARVGHSPAAAYHRPAMRRYFPDLDAFTTIAATADVVPVYRQLLGDHLTPVSAFTLLGAAAADGGGPDDHAFLLESVVGGEKIARHSFIATRPSVVYQAAGPTATVTRGGRTTTRTTTTHPTADPLADLAALLPPRRYHRTPGLPTFTGGLVGYAGYDTARYYEPEKLGTPPPDDRHLPDVLFGLYGELVVFDHVDKTIKVVANADLTTTADPAAAYADACRRVDDLVARLRQPLAGTVGEIDAGGPATLPFTSTLPKDRFEAAVETGLEYIRAGDIFQFVPSQRVRVTSPADPFDVYRALRIINPSPFMFYLRTPACTLIGSSPEILCRVTDGVATSRPLAGTRRRGATEAEDRALEAELLADPKERAEHVMLVDLHRNDLGRVAAVGTVLVSDRMTVERYSHVMHITTNVSARLAPGRSAIDALRVSLPVGTVSGAPKIRAMQVIDEVEPTRRGPYGGAVGYLDFAGNLDTCIALRTIVWTPAADGTVGGTAGGAFDVQSGAGVVADSVPAAEYDETMAKARAMLKAVEIAQRGFLTTNGPDSVSFIVDLTKSRGSRRVTFMLRRVSVDNYRSLVNLDLPLGNRQLLLGRNGAGKTALLACVSDVRTFAVGGLRCHEVFRSATLTRWQTVPAQRFELDVELSSIGALRYVLELRHSAEGVKVASERLSGDGGPLFEYENGRVRLYRDDYSFEAEIALDIDRSMLSSLGFGAGRARLTAFWRWLADSQILRIDSPRIKAEARNKGASALFDRCDNFPDWYRESVLGDQAAASDLRIKLAEVLPGFVSLDLRNIGVDAALLSARFDVSMTENNGQRGNAISFSFDELSDGQRSLIVLYSLLYFVLRNGGTLCIDQPDEYLALEEILPWLIAALDEVDNAGGQLVVVSHNSELINLLAPEYGLWFERPTGTGTRVRPFAAVPGSPLSAAEQVARGENNANG